MEDLGGRQPRHRRARHGLREGIRHRHPDEDAEKLRTVGDAMNYLHEKIGK
jgi:hypothetical protein